MSGVNLEENGDKTPVNYVVPPTISRVVDPSQSQLAEENEQALSITVKNLATGDARAVYKNMNLDMRRYKHLQMFVHANALSDDVTALEDYETSVFIRLGSDYKNNFYEYEIPLKLTPEGTYSQKNENHRRTVWPTENMLDIDLSLLTDLKKRRNQARSRGEISNTTLFSDYDPDKPDNRISVMGNPTLGEVTTIMIGVRNNDGAVKSAEVWVNELRMQEFNNDGGWAAQGNLNVQLSDLGSVNLQGQVITAGFGGLEQSVSERRDEDTYTYSITTSFELGRLFPEKAKVSLPLYYAYSKEIINPKYNPLDTDMLLQDAFDACSSDHERDSLRNLTTTRTINKNFSLSNVRVGIATPLHPMPYDPANFSFNYAHASSYYANETTAWETENSWKGGMNYSYSPNYKPLEPFKKAIKSKSKWLDILKDFGLNYLPQNLTFNTDISRTYYELQERDINNLQDQSSLPLSFAQDFLWNREFSIRWDLTKTLQLSFSSATHAEIEEPYVPVNKSLYPDDYAVWKDSVWQSIKGFGTPLDYQQAFSGSYNLPINKIPCFDWVNADGKYTANYSWVRGSKLEDGSTLGNTINSERNINVNGRLNLEKLYNHSEFLKNANQRFSASGRRKAASEREKKAKEKADAKKKKAEEEKKRAEEAAQQKTPGNETSEEGPKTTDNRNGQSRTKKANPAFKGFAKDISLFPDSQLIVKHNQKTKRIRVTAMTKDGRKYDLKFKKIDQNSIRISGRDSMQVRINVVALPPLEEQRWYGLAQGAARFLMMIRNASLSYRNTYSMALPGFLPDVGDMLGQSAVSGLRPGLDFAFGFVNDKYITKAQNRGWLLNDENVSTPAVTSLTEDLQLKATLEPIADLKIDLTATRTRTQNNSIQYMYAGMPTTQSGSFNMTTISIGSAFEKAEMPTTVTSARRLPNSRTVWTDSSNGQKHAMLAEPIRKEPV